MNKICICVISGGMDSALSAKIAEEEGYEIIALHFNYGQRTQEKELKCFRNIAKSVNAKKNYEIDLSFFKDIGASALTDENIDVPIGGIGKNIPSTYVPFRNGIFLSITAALAEKYGAEAIFIGVVEEDSSGYPDCRASYIEQMQIAINLGIKEETNLEIKMPLVSLKKSEIVQKSLDLNVPLKETWSCYKFEDLACGLCDSCRLRLKGFREAGHVDPISYELL